MAIESISFEVFIVMFIISIPLIRLRNIFAWFSWGLVSVFFVLYLSGFFSLEVFFITAIIGFMIISLSGVLEFLVRG